MLQFDEDQLKLMLMEKVGYEEKQAEFAIDRIRKLDDQLQPILDLWMMGKDIADYPVNGVTLNTIYQHTTTDFLSALVSLSLFAENPRVTKSFLDSPDI
jgi:hypothetical protein